MPQIPELVTFLKPIKLDHASIWETLERAAHSRESASTIEIGIYEEAFAGGVNSGLSNVPYSGANYNSEDHLGDKSALVQLVVRAVFSMGYRLGERLVYRKNDEFFATAAFDYVIREITEYARKPEKVYSVEYCGKPIPRAAIQ